MNNLLKRTIVLLVFFNLILSVNAVQETNEQKVAINIVNADIVNKDNYIKSKYASAENRFLQGNVKTSYDNYSDLISKIAHDDYVFLTYAIKIAEYGFFDLCDELFNRLDKNLYTENYINDIKKFYYPSGIMKPKDTLYLADAYASIIYNNLAIETTSELLNNTLANDSDYKNYLIALGFYKSNNLQQALRYVENAIIQNDNNVNYKILKAKILADSKKTKQAVKTLNEIKKVKFTTVDFRNKVKALEEYVLYKTSKTEVLKDYHLAYYYHLQGKSVLATKVLQGSILQSKQYASEIFGLLGRIYYENNEALKAQEFAQRAFRENKKNYLALLTLADLNFQERKYEDSLKFYKEAKKETNEITPTIGIAKTYFAMENVKKAKKIYEKLIKNNTQSSNLLVNSLKVFPQRAEEYLPVVASVNISNNEIWLGLADTAIKNQNYSMAETYLNNSFYIDESNFRYYYYLSLVLNARGDIEKSKQSLIKCSVLNSDYEATINSELRIHEK